MPDRAAPVLLSLPELPSDVELRPEISSALALAASVVLDHVHGARDRDAALVRDDSNRPAEIVRVPVDDRARASCADLQEATDHSAAAVALIVARRVFARIVFARLPKGTGAAYKMRDPQATDDDAYERLECSGIAEGQESAASRLAAKLDQLARFSSQPAGLAIVTNFRTEPVEIHAGSIL